MNVSTGHGCTPYSRHAVAIVPLLIPRWRPNSREDQCVTPYFFGGGANVTATIRRWSIVRGRPERGSSSRPASPSAAYRLRQSITVGRDTPTLSAIATFASPSAAHTSSACLSTSRL